MSDYEMHLDKLTTYLNHIDDRSATFEEFEEYKKYNSYIIASYKRKQISEEQFWKLNDLYWNLWDGFESVLGLSVV